MQDYIDAAKKNGLVLKDKGKCQCCGAHTKKGIHECLEIFNIGFQDIDFNKTENHIYRFFMVDAHCLQHPEIHGRWSNHFHLSRLHLIFKYHLAWTYAISPKLSDYLNKYKRHKKEERLTPPRVLRRGAITTIDILATPINEVARKDLIKAWAREVYNSWNANHIIVDGIAKGFLKSM